MSALRLRPPVLTVAILAILVAAAAGLATDLGPWYRALRLPEWKPPDAAFGPIWTAIFTACAIAAVRCWDAADTVDARRRVVVLFAVNAILNVMWSVLFFALHRPDWAVWEVIPLWLSVLALLLGLRQLDRLVVPLLLPYLLWVGVAAAMNAQIVQENAPWPQPPVAATPVAGTAQGVPLSRTP